MEFFRKNRRIIVFILAITVALWLLGFTIIIPLLAM